MKRNTTTRYFIVTIALIVAMFSTSVTSAYASNSTEFALGQEAFNYAGEVAEVGICYGWKVRMPIWDIVEIGKIASAKVYFENARKKFVVSVTVQRSGSNIKASYQINKKKYGINQLKNLIKKYSVFADCKAALKTNVSNAASQLGNYVHKYGWTIKAGKPSYSGANDNATIKVKATAGKSYTNITIKCYRKNGKFHYTYTQGGKTKSLATIQKWFANRAK